MNSEQINDAFGSPTVLLLSTGDYTIPTLQSHFKEEKWLRKTNPSLLYRKIPLLFPLLLLSRPRPILVPLKNTRKCTTAPLRIPTPFGWNRPDRKSTRLNSSHLGISYAVFCLK